MKNKFQEYLKDKNINDIEISFNKRVPFGSYILELGFEIKIPNTRIIMSVCQNKKRKDSSISILFYLENKQKGITDFSEITGEEVSKVKELMVYYFQMLDLDLNHCKALKLLNMNTTDEYKNLLEYYMLRSIVQIEEAKNDFEATFYLYYLKNIKKINVNKENEAYVKSLDFTRNYADKLLEPEFNDLLRNNSEDNWKEMIELNYAK
tara:strand:- start:2301 stop:2921 length:621 start_codon:yes stop_codon:yes gene_type:complete